MDSLSGMATIAEALLAFGFLMAILLALADTRLYPIAFGIVVVAVIYVLLEGGAAKQFDDMVKWSESKVGGSKP